MLDLLRVEVFQGPGFSGSRISGPGSRVQSRGPESGSRVQGPGPGSGSRL